MLKKIPAIISPDLMKTLMEMGHGDEIVFADANFPAATLGRRVIRQDGHGIPQLLEAILPFFPLDQFSVPPVLLMEPFPDGTRPDIWETYKSILQKHEANFSDFGYVERFQYYERTKRAFAIVASGETARRGNITLIKGVF